MSRARELAKAGGVQQRIAGFSSHVGMSTFLAEVHMEDNLTVDGNIGVGGNLTVTGTTTFNGGTLTLGDANTDNVVFGGEVDSNIIPDDDGSFDLGSSSKEWKDLFIDGTAHIDTLDVDENAGIIGNLTVTGNSVMNGNVDLGNATGDTITATGRFDSDLVPSSDNARDLGASGLEWKDLYIDGTANIDTLVADTAKVSDLTSGRVVLAGTSGEIEDSGNLTFNGSTLAVTGSQTISVSLDVDGHTDLDNMGVSGVGTITQLVSTTATVGAGLTVTGVIDGNGGANISGAETVLSSATVSDLTNNRVVIAGTSGALEDSGNLTFDGSTLAVTGSQTISGNIDVDGTTNLDAVDIDGAVDMASSLTLAGNADFNGNLDVDGTSNLDAVDIDGAVDMASTLTLAGNADFNGNLDVDGTTNLDGTNIAGALAVSGSATVDNLSLDGNTITTSSGNLTIDSNGGTTTINDNAIISGNLTVNGTTTTINSTTVNIDDKNFQVATGAADDAAADGAGFTVDSGDGDKTWNFEATGDNWGSSENINLASGKVLKVANTSILSSTTLGSSVVTSSLTSLGTIGTGVWQGTAINDTYLGTIDNANKVSLSALNIDGGTDIGAALANTDEIIVDDGGGGTNRRCDMSRVKTYIYGAMSGDATASSGGAVTLAASGVSAGTVGSSTAIPIITVDAKGRITSATTTAVDSTTNENGTAYDSNIAGQMLYILANISGSVYVSNEIYVKYTETSYIKLSLALFAIKGLFEDAITVSRTKRSLHKLDYTVDFEVSPGVIVDVENFDADIIVTSSDFILDTDASFLINDGVDKIVPFITKANFKHTSTNIESVVKSSLVVQNYEWLKPYISSITLLKCLFSSASEEYLEDCINKKIEPDQRKIQGMSREEILNFFYIEYR